VHPPSVTRKLGSSKQTAFFLLLIVGCRRRDPLPPTLEFGEDNPKMNAAIQKARATVQDFVRALQNPKPGQHEFSVKAKVTEGAQAEHMWLTELVYDGQKFTGRLANEPEVLKNVRLNSRWSVSAAEISDWMYVERGRLVGGFTIRVMREHLFPSEREQVDRSFPYRIED
jgi:uncharacterized protein YegJ (DUF2314 family)